MVIVLQYIGKANIIMCNCYVDVLLELLTVLSEMVNFGPVFLDR